MLFSLFSWILSSLWFAFKCEVVEFLIRVQNWRIIGVQIFVIFDRIVCLNKSYLL